MPSVLAGTETMKGRRAAKPAHAICIALGRLRLSQGEGAGGNCVFQSLVRPCAHCYLLICPHYYYSNYCIDVLSADNKKLSVCLINLLLLYTQI